MATVPSADGAKSLVLIVDDDPESRGFLRESVIAAGGEARVAEDGPTALSLLGSRDPEPDLILLDLGLPDMTGLDLLERLRDRPDSDHVEVVVVSGYSDREHKVAALERGATDYLTKPMDREELVARIAAHLRQAHMVNQWRTGSFIDSLTGLLNRRGILHQLEHELERVVRNGDQLAVAFLDLDRFKQVNDRYGHRAGDQILRDVARVLTRSLRGCDVVGRWGGDEFVIGLPGSSRAGALQTLQRIDDQVAALQIGVDGSLAGLSVSAGIADLSRDAAAGGAGVADRLSRLIDAADREMYRVKSEHISGQYTLRREPTHGGASDPIGEPGNRRTRRARPAEPQVVPGRFAEGTRPGVGLPASTRPLLYEIWYRIGGGKSPGPKFRLLEDALRYVQAHRARTRSTRSLTIRCPDGTWLAA